MQYVGAIQILIFSLVFNLTINAQNSFGDRLDLDPELAPFYHGVASGDPLPNAVIIWTRITTDADYVEGTWRIATDTLFTENLQQGSFSTSWERDYTVKIDVTGLSPNTYYYYDFQAIETSSSIGRTKTAPSTSVDQYRILFVSCTDMSIGYFNVYERMMKRNDFDVVYHLGDYIYEYPDDRYLEAGLKVRDVEPDNETITLADYRTRYSSYRLDPKLRDLHQQYPFVVTWDDHETANDSYKDGASNHAAASEGLWSDRKDVATQAFEEWIPIREQGVNVYDDVSRSFKIGDLAEFFVLETRLEHRSKPSATAALFPNLDNSDRGMLGQEQREWLQNGLSNSEAQWKVVVSPTVFTTFFRNLVVKSADGWDGYPWERKQIVNHVINNDVENFVVISGDVHSAYAFDIPNKIDDVRNQNHYNPSTGEGSIGVNFVGTAVSAGLCCRNMDVDQWFPFNPHLKYNNLSHNGYALLDITNEKVTCDYFYVDTVHINSDTSEFWEASWCVYDSIPHLQECDAPSEFNGSSQPFAPNSNNTVVTSVLQDQSVEILSTYPNPASNFIGIQFFLQEDSNIFIEAFDLNGRQVLINNVGALKRGVHIKNLRLNKLSSGEYIISIKNINGQVLANKKIIKL